MILSNKEIEDIKRIIIKAGSMAGKSQRKNFSVKRKEDTSIVTDVDLAVQKFLISRIKKKYPECNLIHEENFNLGERNITADTLTFVIDPIDGTAMYSMYLPIWCVSVGIYYGFEPLYGFVFAPSAHMLFYNNNDHVFLNNGVVTLDNDLPVNEQTNIFFASEIGNSLTIDFKGKIRNLGSTALQACLTVDNRRNRTIAFIGKSYFWDWAGAIPIVLKAGGRFRYLDGSGLDIESIIDNDYALPQFLIAYNSISENDLRDIFIPLK